MIIRITQSRGDFTVIVDDEDANLVVGVRWNVGANGYAAYRGKCMHTIIMQIPKGKYADHINGNKLDNRKVNLRIVTPLQNSYNRGANKNNTSGYKGVSKHYNGFSAQLHIRGKKKHLGLFKTAKQAAIAYDKAAKKHMGEYAKLNFQNIKNSSNSYGETIIQEQLISRSGFVGVYEDNRMKNGRRFAAKIKVNKRVIILGSFFTPEEAATAYNEAIKKYNIIGRRINTI